MGELSTDSKPYEGNRPLRIAHVLVGFVFCLEIKNSPRNISVTACGGDNTDRYFVPIGYVIVRRRGSCTEAAMVVWRGILGSVT